MIGLITADSGRSPKAVAPFGGREARLGTNPISIAIPSDLEAPLYLDMATSAAAAGKIALAVARNETVPDGWVIGSDGRPTNDPRQLRQGGALLPLGGPEGGYKGTGLAVMVEILCGLLTGLGFGVEPTGRHNDGCFMAVFNVAAFRPLAEFKKEVGEFAAYLKSTPPAEGSSGVLYPGEIEHLREAGPPAERHRGRGRDLVQAANPGRGLRPRRQARIHRARIKPEPNGNPPRNAAATLDQPGARSAVADEDPFSLVSGRGRKTNWLVGQTSSHEPILMRLRTALDQIYGPRIERVVLFGSRARGDASPDSDYDVAVLSARHERPQAEMNRLADLSTAILDETGEFIHAMPYRAGSYDDQRMPLMHEIRADGIDL